MLLQPKFQEHKFGNGCITSCIEGGRTFNMTLYKDIFDDEVEKSSPICEENIKTASLN
jgi:hypothetical protein